ncbi:MFS family permease [Thermocatellispora tengchongensis]|uniref:MFS family permease n=1 Tax=Thermocatellispora tengchongensis TaxID=1073253 RepID=A0A840P835_9ACTN|nr:MFS transporter [Thermocatellispora tengchongensis]MBB5134083.1 MFS family permease [Thermocatellispora tengchongensis]
MSRAGPRRALWALCATEITSWGALNYALPVVLHRVTAETGWPAGTAMTAFSTGLVVSAAAGVPVGRLLDRYGPRAVMTTGSVLAACGLVAVSQARTLPAFFAAWTLVGLAQAATLYPPAFAALTRWYGPDRVRALTVLSLAGGLASTVFAPLTAVLAAHLGWRGAYLALAAILALVTIPLHAIFLTEPWPRGPATARPRAHIRDTIRSPGFATLSAALALAGFGLYAATVNLVPLLIARGTGEAVAATALAVCGVGQVLGRIGYAGLSRRTTPTARTVGILAGGATATALLAVLTGPAAALVAAAAYAGAARGAFTLVQATAVSDRWGTRHFGTLNGVFTAPASAAIAVAPAAGALLADAMGGYTPALLTLTVTGLLAAALAARR